MYTTKGNDNGSRSGTDDDNSASEHAARSMLAERQASSCCRRVKIVIVFVAVVAAASYVLAMYVGETEGISEIDLFRGEDPLNGTQFKWRQENGRGLELTVINALTPEWHSYFDLVVDMWDSGTPDGLILTPSIRQPDAECGYVPGALKMCNADFGSTDWKGINLLYMSDGMIAASVGKMNEYFFAATGDEAKRQYTMCHELGHGFGLPHTDERFWNRDQGNCMDYTNRHARNFQPDAVNFEALVGLYGPVGGNTTSGANANPNSISMNANQNGATTNEPESNVEADLVDNEDEGNDDEENRNVRRRMSKVENVSALSEIPKWVQRKLRDIDEMAVHGFVDCNTWRLLHESQHGRSHQIDLGDGHVVQVHYLLASAADYDRA